MLDPLEALIVSLKETKAKHPNIRDPRRTIRKTFYVTPEEDERIKQLRQGVKQSRFFRTRVLGRNIPRPKQATPDIDRHIYTQFSQIRNELKQISEGINQINQEEGTLELINKTEVALNLLNDLQYKLQKHIVTKNDIEANQTDDRQGS